MSGNTQKEEIYRTAMRICRMWGVAETLDSGIPPYETPIATQSAENEKLVLQWAEEYVQLRENGEELWIRTRSGFTSLNFSTAFIPFSASPATL